MTVSPVNLPEIAHQTVDIVNRTFTIKVPGFGLYYNATLTCSMPDGLSD